MSEDSAANVGVSAGLWAVFIPSRLPGLQVTEQEAHRIFKQPKRQMEEVIPTLKIKIIFFLLQANTLWAFKPDGILHRSGDTFFFFFLTKVVEGMVNEK